MRIVGISWPVCVMLQEDERGFRKFFCGRMGETHSVLGSKLFYARCQLSIKLSRWFVTCAIG